MPRCSQGSSVYQLKSDVANQSVLNRFQVELETVGKKAILDPRSNHKICGQQRLGYFPPQPSSNNIYVPFPRPSPTFSPFPAKDGKTFREIRFTESGKRCNENVVPKDDYILGISPNPNVSICQQNTQMNEYFPQLSLPKVWNQPTSRLMSAKECDGYTRQPHQEPCLKTHRVDNLG